MEDLFKKMLEVRLKSSLNNLIKNIGDEQDAISETFKEIANTHFKTPGEELDMENFQKALTARDKILLKESKINQKLEELIDELEKKFDDAIKLI